MIESIHPLVLIFIYVLLINVMGFVMMGLDKRKAIKGMYRTSEKTFFTISYVGGAPGIWLGMKRFRHKTINKSFRLGIPFIAVVTYIALSYFSLKILFS